MAEWVTRSKWTRRALVVLQVVVTLLLIGWLVTKIDRRAVNAALAVHPWIASAAVLVFASAQIWGGLRLHALVPDRKVTAGEAIRATFIGYFFANFLPGTVGGDVVRGIRLKSAGVGLGELTGVLVLDRVINTLFIAAVVALTITPLARFIFPNLDWHKLLIAAVVACCAVACVFLAAGLFSTVRSSLFQIITPGLVLAKHPPSLCIVIVMTAMSVAAGIAGQWLLGLAMNVPVGLVEFAGIACAVTLVGLIPISFNGIGLQEAGYVTALTSLGIALSHAVAFALAVRLMILVASLVGGLVFLAEPLTIKARTRDV
jgi:uncharacterized membrane protein YbhN (UPF0104 family)